MDKTFIAIEKFINDNPDIFTHFDIDIFNRSKQFDIDIATNFLVDGLNDEDLIAYVHKLKIFDGYLLIYSMDICMKGLYKIILDDITKYPSELKKFILSEIDMYYNSYCDHMEDLYSDEEAVYLEIITTFIYGKH